MTFDEVTVAENEKFVLDNFELKSNKYRTYN